MLEGQTRCAPLLPTGARRALSLGAHLVLPSTPTPNTSQVQPTPQHKPQVSDETLTDLGRSTEAGRRGRRPLETVVPGRSVLFATKK